MKTLILSALLVFPVLSFAKIEKSKEHSFRVEVLHTSKDVVWGFDFLAPDRIIWTERGGALRVGELGASGISRVQVVSGVPAVSARGQGGLLDVRSHQGMIYLSLSEPDPKGATTAIYRAQLGLSGVGNGTTSAGGPALANLQRLFRGKEPNSNRIHFGSRIEFDEQGHLFFSMGDRDERDLAQSLAHHNGKILRLKIDGSVPADNPFVNDPKALPEIYSFGHRNPQGLVFDPTTKSLWENEFGPRGGDELNLIKPGLNYGWPKHTYGKEYWGPSIGEGPTAPGIEAPVAHWVPSISPSGMTFVKGKAFPKWEGHLMIGNLSSTHIRRLVLKDGKVIEQESLVGNRGWRFRNVRVGPEGYLYFSTDSGILGRLVPEVAPQ